MDIGWTLTTADLTLASDGDKNSLVQTIGMFDKGRKFARRYIGLSKKQTIPRK